MIQGFETREITDIPIRAFVKSADGTIHKKVKTVDQYENTEWPTFKDLSLPVAVFGVLRGTGDIIKHCMTKPQVFFYFDHAYRFGKRHGSGLLDEKIYRITRNDFSLTYIDKLEKDDYDRIEKYKKHIDIKPWKKEGKYILVLPPSEHAKKFYGCSSWEEDSIMQIKSATKKEIVVRQKNSTDSLEKQLEEAFACVSFNTTACIDALLNGVPSFVDGISCGLPVSKTNLLEIEQPHYAEDRQKWIDSLLANQFTMSEIENGVAYKKVSAWRFA